MSKEKYKYKIDDTGECFNIGKEGRKPVCTVWYVDDAVENATKICKTLNSMATDRQQRLSAEPTDIKTSDSRKRCRTFEEE